LRPKQIENQLTASLYRKKQQKALPPAPEAGGQKGQI
jgi:hypothetical protein